MATWDQSLSNGKSADTGHQNIRHSPYQSCSKLSLPWFDIRVFYVRISNAVVDDYTPECLGVNHAPLDADTLLEVNGVKSSVYSKGISCLLRRVRVDKRSEEAIFVSTDSIRLSGSAKFEVFDRESLVLSGILEMSNKNGFPGDEANHNVRNWSMHCESGRSGCAGFCKGKQVMDSESVAPVIEVYVAGCFSGAPIVLTNILRFSSQKKQNANGMLDSIPEYEAAEARGDASSELDQQVRTYLLPLI